MARATLGKLNRLLRHPVFRNAMALYAAQFADYVLPLVTVPFLARVLQPQGWGVVLYTQAFAMWLGIAVEYGFTLSATREVARVGGADADPADVGEIASGVAGASLLLSMVTVAITIATGFAVPEFQRAPHLLWSGWALAMIQGLRPVWYFQAVEKQGIPSILTIAGRVAFTALVLIVVRDKDDADTVIYLQLVTSGLVFLFQAAYFWRQVRFPRPTWTRTVRALQQGWSIFLLRGSISLYTSMNTILLGWFAPPSQVAFFAGPERLVRVANGTLGPLGQALYPRMVRKASSDAAMAARWVKWGLALIGGLASVGCALLILLAPWLVRLLLGAGYEPAVPVLRILALQFPLVAISSVLGIQWMLPVGLDKELNRVILLAGLINLAMAVPMALYLGPAGMAITVVLVELFVMVGQWISIAHSRHRFWVEPVKQ